MKLTKKKLLFAFASSFFALSMISCGLFSSNKQDAPAPPKFPVLELQKGSLTVTDDFAAEVQSRNVVEIRSRATGYIDKIYVAEGSEVKKGEPIVKINDDDYNQKVLACESAVLAAKANVSNASLEVQKLTPLVAKNIISKFQLETAISNEDAAKATLAQAEYQLRDSKINKGYTLITSPVNGVIGTIDLRVGSLLTNGNLITSVSAFGDVFAYFAFDEKKLLAIAENIPGTSIKDKVDKLPMVEFVLTDGTKYPTMGKLELASGIINSRTGSIQFKAVFENPNMILRTGSIGKVRLPVNHENVVLLPQKSTFEFQDKKMVYIFNPKDSTIKSIAFTEIGAADGYYVVDTGVEDGDMVLYEGLNTVRDNMKIIPRDTLLVK